jgi:F-type H+-transporting ATPase subunit alpha
MKQVAGSLKLDLAQFRELAAFTQFGSDLDKATVAQLERGKRLSELLKQGQGMPIPVEKQILAIFAGTRGFLDEFPLGSVRLYEEKMVEYVEQNQPDILREIKSKKEITPDLEKSIEEVLKEFAGEFRALISTEEEKEEVKKE